MRTHELHPQLVHLPLTLLPMAAATDVAAVITRSKSLDRLGRSLWLLGAGGGIAAGLAGLAASQQVDVDDAAVDDAMYLHGAGNMAIVAASAGVALFRLVHRATLRSTAIGVSACTLSLFTAHLGGQLVYRHGVGVALEDAPRLFSPAAPIALARDAVRGMGWLKRRTMALLSGLQPIEAEALTAAPAQRAAGLGGDGDAQTRH